eukprot:tig00001224_g7642.t1
MREKEKLAAAAALLERAYGKGASGGWKPAPFANTGGGRYLWTDAHGVLAHLSLWDATGEAAYLERAAAIVREVHDVLGRSRDGAHRLGQATVERPTLAGLRIGKEDPPGTEDGDGQYLHYNTKARNSSAKLNTIPDAALH